MRPNMLIPLCLWLILQVVQGEKCLPSDDYPVCAACENNMQTFANLHEMNDAHCDFQHYGHCTVNHYACTLQYDPKCGWNGLKFKTFSNLCMLTQFNRAYYDHYVVVSNCACRDDANNPEF
ncbi:uncharacterized protein LOC106669499 [Cimex lectularius]|uniref:Uncharacterized protein n=1 Tax=Cimex lectularius TaxID=79782 RepID=A0A8I6RY38_CIMLE|nr:uncharacterized protein LOC106669499 [Cimex lectularius]